MRGFPRRGTAFSGFAALGAPLLLVGCSSVPPEGAARIEVALPLQAQQISGGPIATGKIHADDQVTVNVVRLSGPVAMHRHLQSEELAYLLAGAGVFHMKEGDRPLQAGDFVVIPRNTPHGFTPSGGEPAVLLQVFTPRFIDGDRVYEDARK